MMHLIAMKRVGSTITPLLLKIRDYNKAAPILHRMLQSGAFAEVILPEEDPELATKLGVAIRNPSSVY